ncbi:MAG: iron-containing alcohol dehydrogenase [Bacteroidetes bacterium]|nr:iron-containing alcohol dehydrogenase [Bacteroidota bacterium]
MPGSYYIPRVNLIEPGCFKKIGEWTKTLGGSKAFIVASLGEYGEAQGKMVADVLTKDGIPNKIYAGAGPNPTDKMVMDGVKEYKEFSSDILIAIGGGSAMDCAKGIGLVASNGGNIHDFEGMHKSKKNLPHFIAINTTSGTGSEVTSVSIITDTGKDRKMTIVDWRITPDVSVNDAELALSMPASLTAASGLDALSHAFEAMVASDATPITDALSFEAASLIFKWLPVAFNDGQNLEARKEMCHGAFLAGLAFNNSGLGFAHALSHPITAMYGTPHGVATAVVLPAVVKYNMQTSQNKYAQLAHAMKVDVPWHSDSDNAAKVVPALLKFYKQLKIPVGLLDLGVKESDIPALAEAASKELVGRTNPRAGSIPIFTQLYNDSLNSVRL